MKFFIENNTTSVEVSENFEKKDVDIYIQHDSALDAIRQIPKVEDADTKVYVENTEIEEFVLSNIPEHVTLYLNMGFNLTGIKNLIRNTPKLLTHEKCINAFINCEGKYVPLVFFILCTKPGQVKRDSYKDNFCKIKPNILNYIFKKEDAEACEDDVINWEDMYAGESVAYYLGKDPLNINILRDMIDELSEETLNTCEIHGAGLAYFLASSKEGRQLLYANECKLAKRIKPEVWKKPVKIFKCEPSSAYGKLNEDVEEVGQEIINAIESEVAKQAKESEVAKQAIESEVAKQAKESEVAEQAKEMENLIKFIGGITHKDIGEKSTVKSTKLSSSTLMLHEHIQKQCEQHDLFLTGNPVTLDDIIYDDDVRRGPDIVDTHLFALGFESELSRIEVYRNPYILKLLHIRMFEFLADLDFSEERLEGIFNAFMFFYERIDLNIKSDYIEKALHGSEAILSQAILNMLNTRCVNAKKLNYELLVLLRREEDVDIMLGGYDCEAVKALITRGFYTYGSDFLDAVTTSNESAVCVAARYKRWDIVARLVELGADVTFVSITGQHLLSICLKHLDLTKPMSEQEVYYVIKYVFDCNKDKSNKKFIDYVMKYGNSAIETFFKTEENYDFILSIYYSMPHVFWDNCNILKYLTNEMYMSRLSNNQRAEYAKLRNINPERTYLNETQYMRLITNVLQKHNDIVNQWSTTWPPFQSLISSSVIGYPINVVPLILELGPNTIKEGFFAIKQYNHELLPLSFYKENRTFPPLLKQMWLNCNKLDFESLDLLEKLMWESIFREKDNERYMLNGFSSIQDTKVFNMEYLMSIFELRTKYLREAKKEKDEHDTSLGKVAFDKVHEHFVKSRIDVTLPAFADLRYKAIGVIIAYSGNENALKLFQNNSDLVMTAIKTDTPNKIQSLLGRIYDCYKGVSSDGKIIEDVHIKALRWVLQLHTIFKNGSYDLLLNMLNYALICISDLENSSEPTDESRDVAEVLIHALSELTEAHVVDGRRLLNMSCTAGSMRGLRLPLEAYIRARGLDKHKSAIENELFVIANEVLSCKFNSLKMAHLYKFSANIENLQGSLSNGNISEIFALPQDYIDALSELKMAMRQLCVNFSSSPETLFEKFIKNSGDDGVYNNEEELTLDEYLKCREAYYREYPTPEVLKEKVLSRIGLSRLDDITDKNYIKYLHQAVADKKIEGRLHESLEHEVRKIDAIIEVYNLPATIARQILFYKNCEREFDKKMNSAKLKNMLCTAIKTILGRIVNVGKPGDDDIILMANDFINDLSLEVDNILLTANTLYNKSNSNIQEMTAGIVKSLLEQIIERLTEQAKVNTETTPRKKLIL